MKAEKRSPRQWAIDVLQPTQMVSIPGLRIIRDMIEVCKRTNLNRA